MKLFLSLLLVFLCDYAHALSLIWNPVAGAIEYRVYYGLSEDNLAFGMITSRTNIATIPRLRAGQRYYFAVTAFDGVQESDFSNIIHSKESLAISGTLRIGK